MNFGTYIGRQSGSYIADPEVAEIVNIAIELKRPLLVEGEPGCGKTALADSIAKELGLPFYKVSIKSTSRAQDLLYQVNSLARLQDAQTPGNQRAQFLYPYLSLGVLGEAIQKGRHSVVLLDEIDKADIDFPNDLLDVLDRFEFSIPDLPTSEEEQCKSEKGFGRTITGDQRALPIVVITSNREKRLPEPFLRRCLYARLKFPENPETLAAIVRANLGLTEEQLTRELMEAAILSFLTVRTVASGNVQKLPSTSEAIDWVGILHWKGETPESLRRDRFLPPHWNMLFKTMTDLDAYPGIAKQTKESQP